MAHPFTKIFEKALKKKVIGAVNPVHIEAGKIIKKGYSEREVMSVLEGLLFGRIDDRESFVLKEALEMLRGEDDDDLSLED